MKRSRLASVSLPGGLWVHILWLALTLTAPGVLNILRLRLASLVCCCALQCKMQISVKCQSICYAGPWSSFPLIEGVRGKEGLDEPTAAWSHLQTHFIACNRFYSPKNLLPSVCSNKHSRHNKKQWIHSINALNKQRPSRRKTKIRTEADKCLHAYLRWVEPAQDPEQAFHLYVGLLFQENEPRGGLSINRSQAGGQQEMYLLLMRNVARW